MFGKKKNEDDTEKVMKVSADNLTMITIGTIVKGIITIAGGLHLEGTLEGDIICKGKVVIGPQGKVKGNVNCDTAVLYGLLQGDIRATNELYMKSGCMVITSQGVSRAKGTSLHIIPFSPCTKIATFSK